MNEYNGLPRDLGPLLMNPRRFLIASILYMLGPKTMSDLQKATGIPWGPLDTHIRALSSKGYVSTRKILTPFEPRTLVQLTDKGLRSYEELLSKLEEYVRLKRWVVERKTML